MFSYRKGERMAIDPELIDKLLKDYQKPEQIIGEGGLLKQLTKALLERALEAELTTHLGYEKNDPAGYGSGNSRNGKGRKTLKGDFGEMELETPRDRNGSFDPQIVAKGQTRFTGFDDKILSMYARGMSTREIQGHLEEIYGVEVSPTLISNVTDAVIEEVRAWQSRPLDKLYPIVYLDALMVKIRENGQVAEPGDLRSDRGQDGWLEGSTGAVGLGQRGRQILAAGVDGDAQPGCGRCFYRLHRWLEGFSRGDRGGVSPGTSAVMHCAPGQSELELRVVEAAAAGSGGTEGDLRSGDGISGRDRVGAVRTALESDPSGDGPDLAAKLGADHPVFPVPGGDPEGDLYDERGGVAEHDAAQSDQDAGIVSQHGSSHETVVPGPAERVQEMEQHTELARSAEPIPDPVAGADASVGAELKWGRRRTI